MAEWQWGGHAGVRSAGQHRGMMKSPMSMLFALGGWLAVAGATAAAGEAPWTMIGGCSLVAWEGNDGDSFLVECPGQKPGKEVSRVFRLYYVDTPESEDSLPERLEEQRAYWDLPDIRTVVKMGEAAKRFSRQFLAGGFCVHTLWEDAMGRPEIEVGAHQHIRGVGYGEIIPGLLPRAHDAVELAPHHGVEAGLQVSVRPGQVAFGVRGDADGQQAAGQQVFLRHVRPQAAHHPAPCGPMGGGRLIPPVQPDPVQLQKRRVFQGAFPQHRLSSFSVFSFYL